MIVDEDLERVNGMPTKIKLGGIPAYMRRFMKYVVETKADNCKDKGKYGLQSESKLKELQK